MNDQEVRMLQEQLAAEDLASGQKRIDIEGEQRALLSRELFKHQLVFESRPYEAHIQFGTYCNQSCVMCSDGENPPAVKMPRSLLEKVRSQLGPTLSLITPYSGSEPLAANWSAAQRFAEDYEVGVALTTNVELLDRARFERIAPILQTIMLSVDSHKPRVLSRIRGTQRVRNEITAHSSIA